MSIKLRKKSANSVSAPGGMHVQLFVDTDGQPKVKDSQGLVTALSQASTLSLMKQEAAPAPESEKLKLYTMDVSGNTELFVVDSSGNQIQVTEDGALLVSIPAPESVPATELATTGAPVTVGTAAPPSPGLVLTATSATAADWEPITVPGVLTQVPEIQHGSFTAASNSSYYVALNDGVNKTITLPPNPADGDRVEVSALGDGTDYITISGGSHQVYWAGLANYNQTFRGVGFHALLCYVSADGTWTNIAGDVAAYFDTTYANSVIASGANGEASTTRIWANHYVGRIGNNDVGACYNHTIVTNSGITVPSGSLSDISQFTFQVPVVDRHYAFEFHLTIQQSGSAGLFSVTVQTNPVGFSQNATMVRSATEVTYLSGTVAGSILSDAGARNPGTFETTITGGFRLFSSSTQTLVLRASATTGTTSILAGSWGRVWAAVGA